MKKIQLLDTSTINKIAAGEVVERPSSVVKELVENSIDAGSSAITIEIKEGGISLIRVTDNGNGIPSDQVKTAFIRHATNKIQNIEDLEEVISLGFRGEALASIAAVSQIEMVTKTHEESTGSSIEIHGGKVIHFQEAGCPEGTSIIMKNLFYNVPARRKFLKRSGTESGYISDIINKIALGHPEISFKYINNETVILHTSGNNDLKTAIFHVYGKEISKKMINLEITKKPYLLNGLIGKPELSRANRSYENLFINGRFIKSELVSTAIEEAYKTRLMVGKFPVYVLNLEIPPTMVDVNVHPTKLEVRFAEEDEIYQFIFKAVADVLKEKILIPESNWESKNSAVVEKVLKNVSQEKPIQNTLFETERSFTIKKEQPLEEKQVYLEKENCSVKDYPKINLLHSFGNSVVQEEKAPFYSKKVAPAAAFVSSEKLFGEEAKTEEAESPKEEKIIPFFHNYKIIGQIFQTYWIIEQNGSVFMIDQHAAHERILFEKLTKQFHKKSVPSQRLLQPIAVQLTQSEKEILKNNWKLFEEFGFDIEEFGEHSFALRAVPFIFQNPTGTHYFIEIIDMLSENIVQNIYETKIHTIATMACKAAVKGNDKLSFQEAKSMIEQLLLLENPFTCPHGRPTIIEMTKYELEKKFKRI